VKKLKVLQIIDSLNVGGAEVLAVNIANGLSKYTVESHICVTRKEGPLKKKISSRVGYLFLNRTTTIDFKAILKLNTYINKNKIQIVHAHSTSSFIAFCIKLLQPKIKIIWHNHTGAYIYLSGNKLRVLKICANFINVIINVNKDLDNWSKNILKHKNSRYVPNFSNFNDLSLSTKLKGTKDKRITCLANFREVKDHLNLLKAFKIVLETNAEWTLHLVGKNYEDAYSTSILSFIDRHQLGENIFLYGMCSDIKNILKQTEIGVLSSKSEGLPISLLEYGLSKKGSTR
jgi:glycosyltransferase involved in cell wall biosynthesis